MHEGEEERDEMEVTPSSAMWLDNGVKEVEKEEEEEEEQDMLLPVEVYHRVFVFLAPADLARAGLVCRAWHALSLDESVWERVHRRVFGSVPRQLLRSSSSTSSSSGMSELNGGNRGRRAERNADEADAETTWRQACMNALRAVNEWKKVKQPPFAKEEYLISWRRERLAQHLEWACACGHHRYLDDLFATDAVKEVARMPSLYVGLSDSYSRGRGSRPTLGRDAVMKLLVLQHLLRKAATLGHAEVARVLLRHGADPHAIADQSGLTAVDMASSSGNLNVIEVFLEGGYTLDLDKLNVTLRQQHGRSRAHGSLIHQVAALGHVRLMECLLSSILTAQGRGENLAGNVICHQREAIGDLLSKADSRGMTPLHRAVEAGDAEMVRLLLRFGAPIDQVTMRGGENKSPIALAIELGYSKLIQMLIKLGACLEPFIPLASPSFQSEIGTRGQIEKIKPVLGALHAASAQGSLQAIEWIMDSGRVDINSRQPDSGRTPLLLAIKRHTCDLTMIRSLVERFGADVHACDAHDRNAWHYACSSTSADMGKLALLKWVYAQGVTIKDGAALMITLTQSLRKTLARKESEGVDDHQFLATAEEITRFLWIRVHARLTEDELWKVCLSATQCHPRILSVLFEEVNAMRAIPPALATTMLARAVARRFDSITLQWEATWALASVLVHKGNADVNAVVEHMNGQPIVFNVSWGDYLMISAIKELGADMHARNALGDSLLSHHLRQIVRSREHEGVLMSTRALVRFLRWLIYLIDEEVQWTNEEEILDCMKLSELPDLVKTLVSGWMANPRAVEHFPQLSDEENTWLALVQNPPL